MYSVCLPESCSQIVRNNRLSCQNMGLWFNFYTPWKDDQNPDKEQWPIYIPTATIGPEIKDLLNACKQRQIKLLKHLSQAGYACRYAVVKSESRLAAGMGNPNPLENGMTFQYPLGFPIIPASSQKGAMSAYALQFEGKDRNAKPPDIDALKIFGNTSEDIGRGSVYFFDSFPLAENNRLLEADVMTPHYGPYYSNNGKKPPADYYSPVPIKFLTVPENTRFFFSMASRSQDNTAIAWSWLKNTLADIGIGGKTRLGYGRFNREGFDKYDEIKK
ncbi:Putative CRISPR type III-B/RAMP module RAMP protein [Desulfonema limicola]|uniref:CRISPR type III-B/RAMP module RAMP protein n=1 Tax=Desulfonema limicola TaxID=45656 RepID=A0A975GGH4_9BACT|nr:type III-B CRISPR module RAMP protein Cmr6 [Desulfonema limicola]QTA80263.1 Putative CRISPR type III-B/RAMP module RAMP protein [Desulfonema limicola]